MRAGGKKGRIAIFAGMLMAALIGILGWSIVAGRHASVAQSEPSPGFRLVSIQQSPADAEICLSQESDSGDSNLIAAFEKSDENRILALLQGKSVYAASPQDPQTVELKREPVRRLWDTDPSYGAIAFDVRTGKV